VGGHVNSDWVESVLELADNAILRISDKPPVTTEGPLDGEALIESTGRQIQMFFESASAA
jgi:hypothetical protein